MNIQQYISNVSALFDSGNSTEKRLISVYRNSGDSFVNNSLTFIAI